MLNIGVFNELEIKKFESQGAYLGEVSGGDTVLLPSKEVPQDASIGDKLTVFIYKDSSDRLISTMKIPAGCIGDLAYLEVVQNTQIGAFLSWGLDKDVLLPFSEQIYKVQNGKSYLVLLYLDKTGRISATTDIYEYLSDESSYEKNDWVEGTVYLIKEGIGALVAVDDKYRGLIPESECFEKLSEGDRVSARVIRKREDGKLDLSTRKLVHMQMDDDANKIVEFIKSSGGSTSLNDKSSPDDIQRNLNMSKRDFKRAAGKLLKAGKIKKIESGYEIVEDENL